jgi:hypothetical protein
VSARIPPMYDLANSGGHASISIACGLVSG